MNPSGYLLDTSFLSELVKPKPHPAVVAWADARDEETLFISVLTLGELQKGISKLPDSERWTRLEVWLAHDLTQRFHGPTLPVDSTVALSWGTFQGDAERRGTPLPAVDGLIAATARAHNLTVVTRNERDLQRCGVPVENPWSE